MSGRMIYRMSRPVSTGVRRRAVAVAALIVAVGTLASCATPREALGGSESACFQALPVAAAALAGQGRLAGITRIKEQNVPQLLDRLRASGGASTAPNAAPPTTMQPHAPRGPVGATPAPRRGLLPRPSFGVQHAVCLVAFRGSFDASRVAPGLLKGPRRSGQFAAVVVGVRSRQARAVYFADSLPAVFPKL
jgi:hypothetical protein